VSVPELGVALGHVRNATWQLFGSSRPGSLALALDALDLEALLSLDDTEPAVVPIEPDPSASIAAARRHLEAEPGSVAPAAWGLLHTLAAKLA
jgi:hypothetical protein